MAGEGIHPVWGAGLRALRRSLYAEQIFSSIVAEWSDVEALSRRVNESNLATLTMKTSAYRTVAAGHCIRLHFIPAAQVDEVNSLMEDLVASIYRARKADKASLGILSNLQATDALSAEWWDLAITWHTQRSQWLKAAATAFRHAIPEETWANGKAKAQADGQGA